MFLRSTALRRVALLALTTFGLCSSLPLYAHDLPKNKPEVVVELPQAPLDVDPLLLQPEFSKIPLEERILGLYPGNDIFPVERCGIEYTICKFGKQSWDYAREMQLRGEIKWREAWLEHLDPANEADLLLIEQISEEIGRLIEELQGLFDGRPRPNEDEECLRSYRRCLLDELTKPEEPHNVG